MTGITYENGVWTASIDFYIGVEDEKGWDTECVAVTENLAYAVECLVEGILKNVKQEMAESLMLIELNDAKMEAAIDKLAQSRRKKFISDARLRELVGAPKVKAAK